MVKVFSAHQTVQLWELKMDCAEFAKNFSMHSKILGIGQSKEFFGKTTILTQQFGRLSTHYLFAVANNIPDPGNHFCTVICVFVSEKQ